jgi:hypothetical protein
MATRFLAAVRQFGEESPQVGVVVRGFVKALEKDPPPDSEIINTCEYLRAIIAGILCEEDSAA